VNFSCEGVAGKIPMYQVWGSNNNSGIKLSEGAEETQMVQVFVSKWEDRFG
jgi:hypothetical protein